MKSNAKTVISNQWLELRTPPNSNDLPIIYDARVSRYKGVYPNNGRWQAIIQGKGLAKHIGIYLNATEAALAVLNWYFMTYGKSWRKVLTRTERGKRTPWKITRIKSGMYIVHLWINGTPLQLNPSHVGGYSANFVATASGGYWTSKIAAKTVLDEVLASFRSSRTSKIVLFQV